MKYFKIGFSLLIMSFFTQNTMAKDCISLDTTNLPKAIKIARGEHAEFDCFITNKYSNPRKYNNKNKYITYIAPYFISFAKNDLRMEDKSSITQYEFNQLVILIDRYQIKIKDLNQLKWALMTLAQNAKLDGADYGDMMDALNKLIINRGEMDQIMAYRSGSYCWWVFGTDLIETTTRLNTYHSRPWVEQNLISNIPGDRYILEFLNTRGIFSIYQCDLGN